MNIEMMKTIRSMVAMMATTPIRALQMEKQRCSCHKKKKRSMMRKITGACEAREVSRERVNE